MNLQNLTDIHTHHMGRKEALMSLPPDVAMSGCDTPFSLELHPWKLKSEKLKIKSEKLDSENEKSGIRNEELFVFAADKLKDNPNFLAIGECGLDNQCGTPLDIQLPAFCTALRTAAKMHLPVIVHCVGYWAEMMACVKAYYPIDESGNWGVAIIHGYRKGPQLAEQLLRAGFSLSLGEKFNPDVARLVPSDRLWFETDESEEDIWTIRKKILSLRPIK